MQRNEGERRDGERSEGGTVGDEKDGQEFRLSVPSYFVVFFAFF